VLITWSEALPQAQATDPAAVDAVVANARAGAIWRTEFDLPQSTDALSNRLDRLSGTAQNERASM
jgi:hypothetical protein